MLLEKISIDAESKKYLYEIKVTENEFVKLVEKHLQSFPASEMLCDGNGDTRVFRIRINPKGLILITFGKIIAAASITNDMFKVETIPLSKYCSLNFHQVRQITDAAATIPF